MRLRRTLALLSLAAFALTGCTPPAGTGTTTAPASDAATTLALMEVPVSATFGEPSELDRTMYGGSSNGGCVLGPEETMVCTDLSGTGGNWLNAIIGTDQLRNPPSLEEHPPVPLPGFPLTRGIERLDRVLATPHGYLLAVRNNSGTPATRLTHLTPAGGELWAHTVSGPPLRDLAVTADEVLLSTETGISALALTDGKPSTTAAPAGTLLAGSTPGRDGYSTFTAGTVGLPLSAGGTVLTLADAPAATESSCTASTAPAADCVRVQELHADADYLVVAKTSADKRIAEAYGADGSLLWSVEEPVTSAVRLGEVMVLGHAGSNKAAGGAGRLSVMVAATGEEIGTTETIQGGSYYVAGATAGSVIFGVDGEGVPGAFELSYGLMPIAVETAKIPATTASTPAATATGEATAVTTAGASEPAAGTPDDGTAGWEDEESAAGAFTFKTPAAWTVTKEPGDMGDRTTVTDPASGITLGMIEGMNGIGGACSPGQAGLNEAVTVLAEPVPGMHLASNRIGTRTPTLDVAQEGMYFTYSINMTGAAPECSRYADLFEWPGVGTVRIGAKVSAMELAQAGMAPSDYPGSELHRDLTRVLLSVTAAP